MVKRSELTPAGVDSFERPLAVDLWGNYYCLLTPGHTYQNVINGEAELYYKGPDLEGEPDCPVEFVDDQPAP